MVQWFLEAFGVKRSRTEKASKNRRSRRLFLIAELNRTFPSRVRIDLLLLKIRCFASLSFSSSTHLKVSQLSKICILGVFSVSYFPLCFFFLVNSSLSATLLIFFTFGKRTIYPLFHNTNELNIFCFNFMWTISLVLCYTFHGDCVLSVKELCVNLILTGLNHFFYTF